MVRSVKHILILSFFAIALMGCTKNKCQGKIKKDCACTMIYDPVCGCNNVTYGNDCEARCNGIEEYTQGPCKQ